MISFIHLASSKRPLFEIVMDSEDFLHLRNSGDNPPREMILRHHGTPKYKHEPALGGVVFPFPFLCLFVFV